MWRKIERRINGLWIGLFKIRAYVAWNSSKKDPKKALHTPPEVEKPSNQQHQGVWKRRDGRSIKDEVQGMKEERPSKIDKEPLEVVIYRDPVIKEKIESSLVGTVKNGETLENVSSLLEELGCAEFRWRFLGGLDVLIDCIKKETAEMILQDEKHSFREWL